MLFSWFDVCCIENESEWGYIVVLNQVIHSFRFKLSYKYLILGLKREKINLEIYSNYM